MAVQMSGFRSGGWQWRGVMALMAGALVVGWAATAQADEITKTYTITGRARVHIETDDGSVRVSTGDI
jgi:hypothetical protein